MSRLPGWVERFDRRADRALERVRGNRLLDPLMQTATNVAEFSAVWHVVGITRGAVTGRFDQTVVLAVGLGAESLLVNQGLKRLFGRRRPTASGDDRYQIRSPLSSSFPSGHASAAAFAATTLIGWDGRASAALYGPPAVIVALSRPYVRIHHASDVVAGFALGIVLARLFRRALPASVA